LVVRLFDESGFLALYREAQIKQSQITTPKSEIYSEAPYDS